MNRLHRIFALVLICGLAGGCSDSSSEKETSPKRGPGAASPEDAVAQLLAARQAGDLARISQLFASPVGPLLQRLHEAAVRIGEAQRQVASALTSQFGEAAAESLPAEFDGAGLLEQLRSKENSVVNMQITEKVPQGAEFLLTVALTEKAPYLGPDQVSERTEKLLALKEEGTWRLLPEDARNASEEETRQIVGEADKFIEGLRAMADEYQELAFDVVGGKYESVAAVHERMQAAVERHVANSPMARIKHDQAAAAAKAELDQAVRAETPQVDVVPPQAALPDAASELSDAPTLDAARRGLLDRALEFYQHGPDAGDSTIAGEAAATTEESAQPDFSFNSATFKGHTSFVEELAFAPDGKLLASTAEDHTVRLWDLSLGQEVKNLPGGNSVAFSPDGKLLATLTGLENTITVYDAASGEKHAALTGVAAGGQALQFSPDGTLLAGVGFGEANIWQVQIWSTKTGEKLHALNGGEDWGVCLAFSPDGKTLAAGGQNNVVMLWDVASGKPVCSLRAAQEQVNAVCFSADGKTLAVASDYEIELWDVASQTVVRMLSGHNSQVGGLEYSPDGKLLASASLDRSVKVWNASTGEELETLRGFNNGATCLAFSPDGKTLATGEIDDLVRLWTAAPAESQPADAVLEGHGGEVSCVAFSPDGKSLVSIGAGQGGGAGPAEIKLWDTATRRVVAETDGHRFPATNAAFSPDGKWLVTGGYDLSMKVWGLTPEMHPLERPSWELDPYTNMINAVAYSADGKLFAEGGGFMEMPGKAALWDVETWTKKFELNGHQDLIADLAFSRDGKLLATGSFDGTVKLWDTATGEEKASLSDVGIVRALAFSRDGKRLAVAGGPRGEAAEIKLYDTESWQRSAVLKGHAEHVDALAFSPDGSLLASAGGDQVVKLWQVANGEEAATLRGHTSAIRDVAFSPDGNSLASAGGADGTVRLWNVAAIR